MDKDKQRLLQKLYEAIHMCEEQDLPHEKSLLSMAAGCIEDEDPIFNSETFEEMEARVKDEEDNDQ